ncbi:YgdI/YgdR family lipoprotein [Acerihabitans arboris]|uniref:YgdI/YgdR family lipoprotein n=1 Tax=Acerihabitans arboris TaxID=2691583 RepID=A0A845SB27_9GAMM|nr:YgdI/YgdR family lipoprotein [Acerihabitans arboris]NDL61950.1 YgdI/YgdR family lipoprotein [Acerihabitans arboris]
MKKVLYFLSAALLSAVLAGCASNYAMSTNDGRMIVTDGKPQIDDKTGMIRYTDANGNEQLINKNDIKQMLKVN